MFFVSSHVPCIYTYQVTAFFMKLLKSKYFTPAFAPLTPSPMFLEFNLKISGDRRPELILILLLISSSPLITILITLWPSVFVCVSVFFFFFFYPDQNQQPLVSGKFTRGQGQGSTLDPRILLGLLLFEHPS